MSIKLRSRGLALCVVAAMVLALGAAGLLSAASTTKSLSTNFTLINLGSDVAHVVAQYLTDSGAPWPADAANTNFTLAANGGQAVARQYFDATLANGRGSVVLSSDQPLGAVVQILARNQTPTSGAYSGFSAGSNSFYIPLVARRGPSASGTVNSQIIVQNADTVPLTVTVSLVPRSGYSGSYNKTIPNLQPGVSYYYDLDDEANLPAPWFGSAVATASGSGQITVVSNLFAGPDTMQTFDAFPSNSPYTTWLVPLFTSRLPNSLSTPISVQNLSGGTLNPGDLDVECTTNTSPPSSPATFTMSNSIAVANNESYSFNPVTDLSIPSNWQGSCRITATGNVVAFVQMRLVATANAAAYEAIRADGTDKRVFVPLAAKRLANGFATAVTIQNLSSSSQANVTFVYTTSPETLAKYPSTPATITVGPYPIAAGGSLVHNHRLTGNGSATGPYGIHNLPDDWQGSLVVTSADQPIHGFVQLTYYTAQSGDTFMAHDAFTQP